MVTKEKLLTINPEKLADILLSLYGHNKDIQKQLDIVFAGLDADPKKIVGMIKKEIASLKRSSKFVDYYGSDALAERLDQLRLGIVNELFAKSSQQAMELMLEFLDLHEHTLSRADDSNGSVSNVFIEACRDLGKICEQVQVPTVDMVELIFTRFITDNFGIYDELISNCQAVLKEEGFKLLQTKIENSLDAKNEIKIKLGLKAIADCQKDVDAYIRACSFTSKPSTHDHLNIAAQLIDHWRSKEALQWLENMDIPSNHPWQQDRRKLKIQAYELNGGYERAQNERIDWFEDNLSSEIYGQILKHAKLEFKEPFRIKAIHKAFKFPEPHIALGFLMQIQEFAEAAKFVRLKAEELSGRQYYTLRPAADLLQQIDPFAATLLYRKMLQSILEEAKSKYYNYAAKDLVMCSTLSSKITSWENHQPHEAYFKNLEEKHKRKVSFWTEYQSTLQKQAAKDAKQLARQDKKNA